MSYSPLLYEPEGLNYGGLKPPTNKKTRDKALSSKRPYQHTGKTLDPIGTVNDNQTGWVMSGESTSAGRLSGKRSFPLSKCIKRR